jgi:hypothetical protein
MHIQGNEEDVPALLEKLRLVKENCPSIHFVISDLKDSTSLFSLIDDNFDDKLIKTLRLIDYSKLYQEKNHKIIELNMAHKEAQPSLDNSYYLKYKLNPDQIMDVSVFLQNKDPKTIKPYLESSNSKETVEGVLDMNRENFEKELCKKAFTVIEVYSKKCPGCKQIDLLIPQIQRNLKADQ